MINPPRGRTDFSTSKHVRGNFLPQDERKSFSRTEAGNTEDDYLNNLFRNSPRETLERICASENCSRDASGNVLGSKLCIKCASEGFLGRF
jgi:hypothetical protein